MKLKATSKQDRQKLIDTDKRMVVTRGKGHRSVVKGKGGQI